MVADSDIEEPKKEVSTQISKFKLDFWPAQAKYIIISAINQNTLPVWTIRQERDPWLLVDEIIID